MGQSLFLRVISAGMAGGVLGACSPQAVSWDTLVAAKVIEQYPQYKVLAREPGQLLVQRPGQTDETVEVQAIARFCQRGPADCNYAIEKLLIGLRGAQ